MSDEAAAPGADRDPPGGFEWDFAPDLPDEVVRAAEESPAPRRRLERLGPGQTFGGFLLLEQLGQGGVGIVFRARQEQSGREVALKVLGRGSLGPNQLERFRREGELTAALAHPGIVRVHSAGEADGHPWLAYELIPGGRSLEQELGRLDRERAVTLVREVAAAVGHAHARGVVHRDLKPSNVLIDAAGRPRVADFGLALASDQERMTQTGALVGTPSYMSPEQMTGRREVGPPSDVWSLGVILYQALTGRLPFDAGSFFQLAALVAEARPTPPRRLEPSVSAALEAVCLRALAPLPEQRYPDAGALSDELQRALSGERLHTPALPPPPGRRRRWAVWLLLAGLAAACALALRPIASGAGARARVVRLLSAVRHDPTRREELRAALAEGPELPAPLRAEAHLLLAELAEEPAEQLRQARAAAALQAGGEADRLEGLALLALQRPAEAIAPLQRAVRAGGPRQGDLLVALGRALLGGQQPEAAAEVVDRLRARYPGRADGEELELLVLGARQGTATALEELERRQRRGPEPGRELVRARLIVQDGGDPLPALREACLRWGEVAALRAALAEALLERGELEELVARCEGWSRRGGLESPLGELRALAGELLADPLTRPLPRVPARWRTPALRWLLWVGRREAALTLRRRFPILRERFAGSSCAPDGHRQRARARLQQVLALAGAEPAAGEAQLLLGSLAERGSPELARAAEVAARLLPDDPRALLLQAEDALARAPARALELIERARPEPAWRADPRAARLRGEALLALGRPELASEALRLAWQPDRLSSEVGQLLATALQRAGPEHAPEAEAAQERVARLEGSRRAEAWDLVQTGRNLLKRAPRERDAAYQRALELDPLCEEARFFLCKGQGNVLEYERSLPALLVSVCRLPYLYLAEICEELRGLATMTSGGRSNLHQALARLGPDPAYRLSRAFLLATMVEYENYQPEDVAAGLDELSAFLEEQPAEPFAWALRGLLHIRAGLLPQAERDLSIAHDCAPACVGLYLALLAGARRAPAEEVFARLEDAFRRGYPPTNVEALPRYPELAPYLADDKFRERVAKLGGR